MLRRANRSGVYPAVCFVIVLCLGMLTPGGSFAAQPEAATPIPPGQDAPDGSLPTGARDDVHATALNAAYFDQSYYFLESAGTASGVLIIQMAGLTSGGTFSFGQVTTDSGIELDSTTATPGTPGATCEATLESGTVSGSFANAEIGPGRCEIGFTLVMPGSVASSGGLDGSIDWGDSTSTPVSAVIIVQSSGYVQSAGFAKPLYQVEAGGSVTVDLVIVTDGINPSPGSAMIAKVGGVLSYDAVATTLSNPDNGVCLAEIDLGDGNVYVTFSNDDGSLLTCTVSVTMTLIGYPGDMEPITVGGLVLDPLRSFNTTIAGYNQPSVGLSLNLGSVSAYPQDTVSGVLTLVGPLLALDGRMQVVLPEGVSLVPGSGAANCAPIECTPLLITEGPSSIQVTIANMAGSAVVSLSFDVRIDDDAPVSTVDFRGQAELSSGLAASRPEPASASLGILEGLAAGDQHLTIPYRGTANGVIAVTGGVPGYDLTLQDAPTLGDLDFDPGSGEFTYTAHDLAAGSDVFTVLVTDSGNPTIHTALATVHVTIEAPPVLTAVPTTMSIKPGTSQSGTLAGQVSGGMPPIVFSALTQPAQGSVTIGADGSFSLAANDDATGSDSFTYQVTDSEPAATGLSEAAIVTGVVTIEYEVIPPTATPTATATATATVTTTPAPEPTGTMERVIPPPRPAQTATPTAESASGGSGSGTGSGTGVGTGVTTLPSTGAGSETTGSMLLILLASVLLLLAGSVAFARRR